MDNLYIVIPAYNEEKNINKLIDDWYPIIERHNLYGNSRLVVINDGSKDATYEILINLAKEKPLLVPITKTNSGHGPTVLFGYRYALEHGADYIFQTDSDGQTDPSEFEPFFVNRDNYDAVIGRRIVRGDGKARKIVEDIVCMLLHLYFGVKIKDANAPYRLMRAELLSRYIDMLPEDYNLPNIMLTCLFVRNEEKIKFIDITFKARQGGTNTIDIKKIIRIGWKALGDFYKFRKEIDKN